tara:strand:+ start:180 stop:401 length:222 start_codon:yes stop_codon:yes gene_type:complete
MIHRAIADNIWILVYEDKDGKDCFAFWGSWGNRQIRWYKTKKQAEERLAEVKNSSRGKDLPNNVRVVKFVMEK